ncbi:glycosyltransferase [Geodermatophilus sp. URMC 61]|uniref:glycosyltransferase n=1 Tax=Geodermatophilus sp. URMC 61 TaxID=3423411 RepID=UPI00406D0994
MAHDYFTQRGGAERVAILLAQIHGEGSVTTSAAIPENTFPEVRKLHVRELLRWLPRALARRRGTLAPFAGLAFLAHRVDDGVVVCSTSGWAHWLRGRAPRVVYCHTPARWLYEPADYFKGLPPLWHTVLGVVMAPLRALDRQRTRSAAVVLANGPVTADRIRRVYGLKAPIVIPPPGIDEEGPQEPVPGVHEDFCLTVSRPRSYKNLDLVTSVFSARRQEQLVVVGGTVQPSVEDSVLHVGRVSDAQLRWLYQHARAVICVAREDLGLVPIEAFQFGTPAVALRAGGYLATCTPGRNAVFVESEDADALDRALDQLRDQPLERSSVRASAEEFSVQHFREVISGLVTRLGAGLEHTTEEDLVDG